MKATKLLAILAMMWMSSVWAECPVQETTIVFMNGVWTTESDARDHAKALEERVYARGIPHDCVHFGFSHTQDNGRIGDIVEGMIQKSIELDVDLLSIVRVFFLVTILSTTQDPFLALAFDQVLTAGYESQIVVTEAQTGRHLNNLKTIALDKNHRGIMVTHSQGGLYGNAVWDRLTPVQQTNTRMVSVVTPAAFVAGVGANTRLSRDGVANRFFLAALLEGTIPNTGRLCDKEAEETDNSWPCHGFETGYLHDPESRTKIVNDIVALLPAPPRLTPTAQGRYVVFNDGNSSSDTETPSVGQSQAGWLSFDVRSLRGVRIDTITFRFTQGDTSNIGPPPNTLALTIDMHDVSTPFDRLVVERNPLDAEGEAILNDLKTGEIYATFTAVASGEGVRHDVVLGSTAIRDLQAAIDGGEQFWSVSLVNRSFNEVGFFEVRNAELIPSLR